MEIFLHADDFGANSEVSNNILDCGDKLYSLSVLANAPGLAHSLRLYKKRGCSAKLCLHLNLAEGESLAGKSMAPLLTDERGMFKLSFFRLLIMSYFPRRKALKKQIKREFALQTDRFLSSCEVNGIPRPALMRIDSHQHYHMIPLVLEAALEVMREKHLKIGFIRIPAEPLGPFVRTPGIWKTVRLINLLKNLVLNALAKLDRKILLPYRARTAVFFGIMLSGGMDKARVSALLPRFKEVARKRGLPLEILAHPGGCTSGFLDPANSGCVKFYSSKNRRVEKYMLTHLNL